MNRYAAPVSNTVTLHQQRRWTTSSQGRMAAKMYMRIRRAYAAHATQPRQQKRIECALESNAEQFTFINQTTLMPKLLNGHDVENGLRTKRDNEKQSKTDTLELSHCEPLPYAQLGPLLSVVLHIASITDCEIWLTMRNSVGASLQQGRG